MQIIFTSQTTTTIAESVRVRCEEIHAASRDNTIAAIICTIGGAHANELLHFLDFFLVRSNPKIFVGDTTFLHYAIQSRTGLRTFYGPSVLTDFSDFPRPMQFTIDHFLRVLTEAGTWAGPLPRLPICSKEHSDFLLGNEVLDRSREVVDSPSWSGFEGAEPLDIYTGTLCLV